jgi:predicted heme/steroid binding protein
MAEKIVSSDELRRNNGERGRRRWVAHAGVVYDVSDCPNWRTELHQGQHFAGQDLTQALHDAPHGPEVFWRACVQRVGVFVE